jgi:hypothetical protein
VYPSAMSAYTAPKVSPSIVCGPNWSFRQLKQAWMAPPSPSRRGYLASSVVVPSSVSLPDLTS